MSLWGWTKSFFTIPYSTGNANSPSTMSPQVLAWQHELWLCRTLYGGWETVQAQREKLLPRHPAEDPQDYEIRVCRPTFYNAFGRTVRALAGTVFKDDPQPQGIPTEIQALYDDDIDLQGTSGPAFLLHTFQDSLVTGIDGIFVDMPANTGGITKLEAQQLDIRPYWRLVRKDDIVSFRVDIVNGKTVLGQLVVKECVEEQKGDFGVELYDRYRVYRRTADAVTFEAWESESRGGRLRRVGEVGTFRGVTEIPFAPIYTAREDFMEAKPPLLDLANLNLLHYLVNSDLHHAVHLANVPIIVTQGFEGDMQLGPNRSINFPAGSKDSKAYWMETTGAALGSTRAVLADIEEQMSNLGLGMLQRKSRAAETAQKAQLDRQEQDSTLAAIVSDLENGIELALSYTAQFMGDPDGQGGRLEFSRNFQLDPASADRTQNQGDPTPPADPKQTAPAGAQGA
jgi:Domain of unknown function (DUF4055)